jgi:hypothetical protein
VPAPYRGCLSNQARFRLEQVSFAGKTTAWARTAESGSALYGRYLRAIYDSEAK